jgi:hypothetical protein
VQRQSWHFCLPGLFLPGRLGCECPCSNCSLPTASQTRQSMLSLARHATNAIAPLANDHRVFAVNPVGEMSIAKPAREEHRSGAQSLGKALLLPAHAGYCWITICRRAVSVPTAVVSIRPLFAMPVIVPRSRPVTEWHDLTSCKTPVPQTGSTPSRSKRLKKSRSRE